MKNNPTSLVVSLLVAAISVAACSSSDDTPSTGSNNGQNPGSGGNPTNNDGATTLVDLRTISDSILLRLAGYDLETVSEEIALIADTIVSTAPASTALPGDTVELVDQGNAASYPITSVRYDCAQGGTLTLDTLAAEVFQNNYSSNTRRKTYQFEQCRPSADIDQTLNGNMSVSNRSESSNRFSTIEENSYLWQSFQWQQPNAQTVNITASIDINTKSSQDNDDNRNVTITEYTNSESGIVQSGVRDATFTLQDNSLAEGAIVEFRLQTQGNIIDPSGATIAVMAQPEMYRKFVNPILTEPSVPFSGQISYTSSDGSSLQMTGKGSDLNGRLVDITYTDAAGITSTAANQSFPVLEARKP